MPCIFQFRRSCKEGCLFSFPSMGSMRSNAFSPDFEHGLEEPALEESSSVMPVSTGLEPRRPEERTSPEVRRVLNFGQRKC